jgi:ubiquinone/menaquinone biosynthesis C-methylase UbiE
MVPFVPTPAGVIDEMIVQADLKPGMHAVDLGAGDGRVLRRAMRKVPGIKAVGYEGAFGVWLLAKFLNVLSPAKPEMKMQNFFNQNFSDVDIVFTYLSIDIMQKLLPKLEKELKPGAKVISNTFSFKKREPVKKVFVKMPFWGGTNVLVYQF